MDKEKVNHPRHYNQGNIECIDAMVSAYGERCTAVFCELNAFKYIWRCNDKQHMLEDLKKAHWYLEKAIELNVLAGYGEEDYKRQEE